MSIPTPEWSYRAKLIEVTDGDTVVFERDLGDHLYQRVAVRLLGLNCPEKHGATQVAGLAAMVFTQEWLKVGSALDEWPVVLETHLNQREKYGRLLARVWRVVDGAELNQALLDSGHAIPFMVGAHHD